MGKMRERGKRGERGGVLGVGVGELGRRGDGERGRI
jgi:hypothetical protein